MSALRDFLREFVPGMACIVACIVGFGFAGGFLVSDALGVSTDWAILLAAYAGTGVGLVVGNLVSIRYLGWFQ